MTARASDEPRHTADEFDDEFGTYLAKAKQGPAFRAEYEDAEELHRAIDSLVKLRKVLDLSQTDVAERMGIRQPTVSGFEKESSDPRLSTLQRYARAVEAKLHLIIEMPAECDWVSASTSTYRVDTSAQSEPCRLNVAINRPTVRQGTMAREWIKSGEIARTDWELSG